jgi:hypothetical protein
MTAEYTLSPETPTAVQADSAVTLATVTDGAAISYTVDGSDPADSGTKKTYTAGTPITLSAGTTTVKAVATKANWANSAVFSGDFTHTVSANPPPSDGDSDPLTAAVNFGTTTSDTSGVTIGSFDDDGAAQAITLSVVEEPLAFFTVQKNATQTITVGGTDATKVAMTETRTVDGTAASAAKAVFSVNMEDLLFNGGFGGSPDGAIIPTGKETRTFTLTVSESNCTSRVITVALDITLDKDTETTIYHREGEPENYHYVKVRDAELTENDETIWTLVSTTKYKFKAFTKGQVGDLQNAFVWVDHHGTGGTDGSAGFANGTTQGYSEYRLFVKKNQNIGKIVFIVINSRKVQDNSLNSIHTDLRNYLSIELYGAGTPGTRTQRITRSDAFSATMLQENVLNNMSKEGLISLSDNYDYKYKALVLGKNITLAGDGTSVPILGTSESIWHSPMGMHYLLAVDKNALVIIDDHAKITDFYGTYPLIKVGDGGKLYLKGGAITGNAVGTNAYLIENATANDVVQGSTAFTGNTVYQDTNAKEVTLTSN